jgi:hypothetical protein
MTAAAAAAAVAAAAVGAAAAVHCMDGCCCCGLHTHTRNTTSAHTTSVANALLDAAQMHVQHRICATAAAAAAAAAAKDVCVVQLIVRHTLATVAVAMHSLNSHPPPTSLAALVLPPFYHHTC